MNDTSTYSSGSSMFNRFSNNILFQEFIYGGHLQCLGAAGISLMSSTLLNIEFSVGCFVVAYLLLYPAYLYNRYAEMNVDEQTNPRRTEYLRRYAGYMPVLLVIVVCVVIAAVVTYSNRATLFFGLILIAFGLLYTTTVKSLTKYIPVLKNLYVSAFFASLVVFPLFYFDISITPQIGIQALALAMFVYLKSLVMQIFLDIKDVNSDHAQQLRTLPAMFGKEKTLPRLLVVDLGLSLFFPVVFFWIFGAIPVGIWAFALTAPLLVYCYQLVWTENYSGYILRSSEFLSWSVVLLLMNSL